MLQVKQVKNVFKKQAGITIIMSCKMYLLIVITFLKIFLCSLFKILFIAEYFEMVKFNYILKIKELLIF